VENYRSRDHRPEQTPAANFVYARNALKSALARFPFKRTSAADGQDERTQPA